MRRIWPTTFGKPAVLLDARYPLSEDALELGNVPGYCGLCHLADAETGSSVRLDGIKEVRVAQHHRWEVVDHSEKKGGAVEPLRIVVGNRKGVQVLSPDADLRSYPHYRGPRRNNHHTPVIRRRRSCGLDGLPFVEAVMDARSCSCSRCGAHKRRSGYSRPGEGARLRASYRHAMSLLDVCRSMLVSRSLDWPNARLPRVSDLPCPILTSEPFRFLRFPDFLLRWLFARNGSR